LVRKVAPAVVNISGKTLKKEFKTTSLGSGFIINKKGYIITANNLLDDAKEITVTLLDNRRFAPKIIGRDSASNVPFLRLRQMETCQ